MNIINISVLKRKSTHNLHEMLINANVFNTISFGFFSWECHPLLGPNKGKIRIDDSFPISCSVAAALLTEFLRLLCNKSRTTALKIRRSRTLSVSLCEKL